MNGETARVVAHEVCRLVLEEGGALVRLEDGTSLLGEGLPEFDRVEEVATLEKLTTKEIRRILWGNRANKKLEGCNALGVLCEREGDREIFLVSYVEVSNG